MSKQAIFRMQKIQNLLHLQKHKPFIRKGNRGISRSFVYTFFSRRRTHTQLKNEIRWYLEPFRTIKNSSLSSVDK